MPEAITAELSTTEDKYNNSNNRFYITSKLTESSIITTTDITENNDIITEENDTPSGSSIHMKAIFLCLASLIYFSVARVQ